MSFRRIFVAVSVVLAVAGGVAFVLASTRPKGDGKAAADRKVLNALLEFRREHPNSTPAFTAPAEYAESYQRLKSSGHLVEWPDGRYSLSERENARI